MLALGQRCNKSAGRCEWLSHGYLVSYVKWQKSLKAAMERITKKLGKKN